MNKKIIGSTIALALTSSLSVGSANAALAADAILDFAAGVGSCQAGGTFPACSYGATTTSSGSYFAMDTSAGGLPGVLDESERVLISSAGTGVTLGQTQARGEIDNKWDFSNNPGEHYTNLTDGDGINVVSASGNTATINMSGWTVWWGNVAAGEDGPINMGTGADAIVTCAVDCAVGDTFALDYEATVPSGGFTGVLYGLHLEGVIGAAAAPPSAVPVPAAVWLFGSGLVGLAGIARRRKSA